jgi:hypothetical protein
MYFIRDGIVDSLMEVLFIYDVITIVKSITFKLKTININIYIFKIIL